MTEHADHLRGASATPEKQTPDPAAVYARVQGLARRHPLRRWGAQAAGGAVLTAGLIAGAPQLPSLPGGAPQGSGIAAAAAPAAAAPATAPKPSSTPTGSTTPQSQEDKEYAAYFAAGYDYDSALKLARLWHRSGDIGAVKAEAGKRLLAGKKLPVKPNPAAVQSAKEIARVNAFFAAGYDFDDAARLAKIWKTADPYHAKILGGKKLLAGQALPIRP